MIFVDYGKYGFKCFDSGGSLLFAQDSTHNYLFEYIEEDLSVLPKLLDEYIRSKLDIETFALLDGLSGDEYLEQIETILKSAHPYYEHEHRKTCIESVGNLFNKLLLYCCCCTGTLKFETTESKDWYIKRIEWLLKPLLRVGENYPSRFYQEYKEHLGTDSYTAGIPKEEYERLIFNVPRRMPTGFSDEIMTQEAVRNMLYFTLDIVAPDLSTLKTSQRLWLFNNMFYLRFHSLNANAKRRLTFVQRPQIDSWNNCSQEQEMERAQNLQGIFANLHFFDNQNFETDGVPQEAKYYFDLAIKAAKEIDTTQIYEEYEVSNLTQLLCVEIMSMVENETMIRRCRNCGKYFIVNNRKTAYCDRIDPSGERCSAVGPSRNFQKKMEEDNALKIYTRAYKTHFARVKKGTMEKNAFAEWCKDAKEKLKQVRAGQLDLAVFQKWLKD